MANGATSTDRQPTYHDDDDSEEDVQLLASETRNDSPSSAHPIPVGTDIYADVEQGEERPRGRNRPASPADQQRTLWGRLATITNSLVPRSVSPDERRRREVDSDRDR